MQKERDYLMDEFLKFYHEDKAFIFDLVLDELTCEQLISLIKRAKEYECIYGG